MSALIPPKAVSEEPLSGTFSYGFIGNAGHTSKQDDYLVQRPFKEDGKEEEGGGELMFGGGRGAATAFGMPSYRVGDDSIIDDSVARYLRTSLNNELDLNNNEELETTHEWSGIMGYSRDGYPWVGQVPQEMLEDGKGGLFVCAGFTGHGMANASLAARWVGQHMLRGGAHFKIDTYGKGEEGVEVLRKAEKAEKVKMPTEMLITAERRERALGLMAVQVVDLMEDDLHL